MKGEEVIIGICRMFLLVAGILCLLGWLYVVYFSLAWSGLPRNFEDGFFTFFPLVYFALTIYGCVWVKVRRVLIGLGVTLNLPLAILIAQIIGETGELGPLVGIGLAFIVVWLLLCLGYAWFRSDAA